MLGEYIGAGSGTTKLLLHLNGNSTDSSGNGNNGTDTNITYSLANGKFGQGANFNGSNTKITLSKNSNTYLYNNWTMVAWVKRNSSTSGVYTIYQMGNCNFSFGSGTFYDGNDRTVKDSNTPTDTTNFYCYIWTKSSTGGSKLYRDGNLVGSQPTHTGNNSDAYSNVTVGRFNSPGDAWFNGKIDEVILENRVWTASEIKKYYTNSLGRF